MLHSSFQLHHFSILLPFNDVGIELDADGESSRLTLYCNERGMITSSCELCWTCNKGDVFNA